MANCITCGKPLNESCYDSSGRLKSCPRCSVIDGDVSVLAVQQFGFNKEEGADE